MRLEGVADKEIVGLFRHAADELDEATMTRTHRCDKKRCEVVEIPSMADSSRERD